MPQAKKEPNPTDVHVGSRVRLRRTMMGMSQEKLGEALGVTFQQIQKYEKGTNRIGASRMQQIVETLGVSIDFFFEGLASSDTAPSGMAEAQSANYVVDFLNTSEGIQLNRAFSRISDPKVRRKVIELLRTLADDDEDSDDATS